MKKILIVKIGAIGDVIMALPVITEIKAKYTESQITWVCGNVVAALLKQIPAIDIVINVDERKIFSGNKITALKEIMAYQTKVAFNSYDLVLNYHPDVRYKIFSLLVRSAKTLTLNRDTDRPALIPARSRSFEHVRLFLQDDDNYLDNIYFPADTIRDDLLIGNGGIFNYKNQPFVILAPGGAKNSLSEQELRRWPIQNYVEIAKHFREKGLEVIITGIKSDEWVLPYFNDVDIINLTGQLSLIQLIALMRHSLIAIMHDSGPFHLGVFAQSCFVIGLFGPTNPAEFTYGAFYKDKVKTLWEGPGILCSPCYYGKYFSTKCTNNVCMQMLTSQKVIALADDLLLKLNVAI